MTQPFLLPPGLHGLLGRLDRWGQALAARPSSGPGPITIVIAVLAGLLAVSLSSPAVFVNDVPFDLFIPLDGAWRMANGQWPHIDFTTPVGILYYLELAAAEAITGPDPRLALWANALFLIPLTLGTLWATQNRLSAPMRVLVVLAIALLAIAPRVLDDGAARIAHLAFYNRQGAALTCIAWLALFVSPHHTTRYREFMDGLLIAICAAAAAFLKITFLGLIAGGLIVALLLGPSRRLASLALGLTAAILAIITLAAPDFVMAYVADITSAAQASSGGTPLSRLSRLPDIIAANWGMVTVAVLAVLILLRSACTPEARRHAAQTAVQIVALITGSLLVTLQNHDTFATTSLVPLLLVFVAWRDRPMEQPAQTSGLVPLVAAVPLLWIWGSALAMDATSILVQRIGSATGQPVAESGPLARFVVPDNVHNPPSAVHLIADGRLSADAANALDLIQRDLDLPFLIRDGQRLLSETATPDQTVLTLSFAPVFSIATRTPPPRGTLAWWDNNRTFNAKALPDMDKALKDADLVMVSQLRTKSDTALWAAIGPDIKDRYTIRAQTPLWVLWQKRQNTDVSGPAGLPRP